MIPKIIHYCWFGGGPFNEVIDFCMASWKKNLPDYEVIRWDETNFDLENAPNFVKTAFQNKKWAFVSDYVRAYALYHHGGVYLDTDVEIKQSLNPFLTHGAFSGFEQTGSPFTALWAAEKNHRWPKLVLEYYERQPEFSLKTNTRIVSEILEQEYKVDPTVNGLQKLDEGIFIYPSETFCVDVPVNFACHHFNCSWVEKDEHPIAFKDVISLDYYQEKYYALAKDLGINLDQELVKKVRSSYLISEIFTRALKKTGLKK